MNNPNTTDITYQYSEEDFRKEIDAFSSSIDNVDIKNLLNEDVERSRNAVLTLTALIITFCLFGKVEIPNLDVVTEVKPVAVVFILFLFIILSAYYLINAKTDRISKHHKKETLDDSLVLFELYLDKFEADKFPRFFELFKLRLRSGTFIEYLSTLNYQSGPISSSEQIKKITTKLIDKIERREKARNNLIDYIKYLNVLSRKDPSEFVWWSGYSEIETEVLEEITDQLSSTNYFMDLGRLVKLRDEKKSSLRSFKDSFESQMKWVLYLPYVIVFCCGVSIIFAIVAYRLGLS